MAKGKKPGKGAGKKPAGKKTAAKKPVAAKPKAAAKAKVKAVAAKPASVPAPRPAPRRPVKARASAVRMPAARPAGKHHAAPATANIFERDLERNAANYAPLSPLQFLERAASVYPERASVVHGHRRYTWSQTYERCRRLASALEKRGIGIGDTVTVMAPNIPEIYEAHFGVPMCGAVLNALNTRLDAAMIAFILDHSETKVLMADREYHGVIKDALAKATVKPLVIDIADSMYDEGAPVSDLTYEGFIAEGDPDYAW